MSKIYLTGPMSNIPAFNFPAFHAATAVLRAQGWEVVSPAEEDCKSGVGAIAEASKNGDPKDLPETWGDLLSRDVKIIADGGIEGIVFLPDWQRSRGSRLEAFVGLLHKKFEFYLYEEKGVQKVSRHYVRSCMMNQFKYEEYA